MLFKKYFNPLKSERKLFIEIAYTTHIAAEYKLKCLSYLIRNKQYSIISTIIVLN